MLHRFYGGVHPAGRKKATCALATVPMATLPAQVALAVCAPLVAVGDYVCLGQRLCDGGETHPAVHASVSGKVVAIEPRVQTDGAEALCVVLGNDTLDTPAAPGKRAPAEAAPGTLDGGDIRAAITWAGIGGMGGEGFPTGRKLERALGRVDTLIINGGECEPYLTADHRLMVERAELVLTGARLLARALGLTKAVIAVEGDKYDAVTALRALLPLRGGDIEVKVLRARYPQGSEKQLIQKITGRKVPPGDQPDGVGCAVFNVATAAAVADAVYDGKPLTARIVTVAGAGVRAPKNLIVPLGTPISDLITAAAGFSEHPERVLAGGGMMGIAQVDLSAPITQGTGAVVAMTRKETKPVVRPQGECLRCGKCVDVCPMRLEPVQLRLYAEKGRWREVEKRHIADCIECGTCAYSCPAKLHLVADIRAAKAALRRQEEQREGERHE